MKKYLMITGVMLLLIAAFTACHKSKPIDGDGLLITPRGECYVSSFELLGADYVSVLTKLPVIDTTAQTVSATVQFGTDLKNLYPQFTLATDCKLDPKITGWTDFSDLNNPQQWTVISGNRQVQKTYKVLITVQPR